jgi:hypothetical protein
MRTEMKSSTRRLCSLCALNDAFVLEHALSYILSVSKIVTPFAPDRVQRLYIGGDPPEQGWTIIKFDAAFPEGTDGTLPGDGDFSSQDVWHFWCCEGSIGWILVVQLEMYRHRQKGWLRVRGQIHNPEGARRRVCAPQHALK